MLKVMTKRSTHVAPTERDIQRLKGISGRCMRKVALELES